jgi:hypothetical protein
MKRRVFLHFLYIAALTAAHFQYGFRDLNPIIEIYSAPTGQLVLPLGVGSNPEFQP